MSKAKINLNKYWHKFEEILTAAGDDIKMMSSSYHDFIASRKSKYHAVDRPDMLTSPKLNLFSSLRQPPTNNVQDQLQSVIGKTFDTETNQNNLNDSTSSYKPFVDDELYYGVNLNAMLLPTIPIPTTVDKKRMKRCSCHLETNTSDRKSHQLAAKRPTSFHALPHNYQFTHRSIQLSYEDYQNLENEAMEVCQKYSYYDTSF